MHKSKIEGPIVSGPEGFIDGPTRYRAWLPESDQHADEWFEQVSNEMNGFDVAPTLFEAVRYKSPKTVLRPSVASFTVRLLNIIA